MMPDHTDSEDLPEIPGFPWERVSAMLAGELSEAERDALMQWIHEDPEREQLFASVEAMWREGERNAPRFDAERGLSMIRARAARRRSTPMRRASHIPLARQPLAWAAALVLGVGLASYLSREQLFTADAPASPVEQVATARGQRAIIQLIDGSRVTLGVASTLKYRNDLDTVRVREVELEGEAYFEVPHDATRPFVVRTTHGVARDLGTKFAVRAYANTARTEVVVAEGLVSLTAPVARDSILLRVADLGRIDAQGRMNKERGVDVRAMLAWTRGELVFAATPVREVVARLNVWYDARVVLSDTTLASAEFTGSYGSEPVTLVLRELAAAIGARMENRNGEFVLTRDR